MPLQCLWRDSVTLISTLLLTYTDSSTIRASTYHRIFHKKQSRAYFLWAIWCIFSLCFVSWTLRSLFRKRSVALKLILFRPFWICLHDIARWKSYEVPTFCKFRSCVKLFFSYHKYNGATGIMLDLIRFVLTHYQRVSDGRTDRKPP